jgi:hypothetical protein
MSPGFVFSATEMFVVVVAEVIASPCYHPPCLQISIPDRRPTIG